MISIPQSRETTYDCQSHELRDANVDYARLHLEQRQEGRAKMG